MDAKIFLVAQVIACENINPGQAHRINETSGWKFDVENESAGPSKSKRSTADACMTFKLSLSDMFDAIHLSHKLYCPTCG